MAERLHLWTRLTVHGECRAIIGMSRVESGPNRGTYISLCRRWKHHGGECQPHTRHTQIESYYEINRTTWPDMSRRRALWSAWRTWRMTREHMVPSGRTAP